MGVESDENQYFKPSAATLFRNIALIGTVLNIIGSLIILINYRLIYRHYVKNPIHPGMATHYRLLRYFAYAHLALSALTILIIATSAVRYNDWICIIQAGFTVFSQLNTSILVMMTCINLVLGTYPHMYDFLRGRALLVYCLLTFGIPFVAFLTSTINHKTVVRTFDWCIHDPSDTVARIVYMFIWMIMAVVAVVICPIITAYRLRRRSKKLQQLDFRTGGLKKTAIRVALRFVPFMAAIVVNVVFAFIISVSGVMKEHKHQAVTWSIIYYLFTASICFWPAITLTWSRHVLRLYKKTLTNCWRQRRMKMPLPLSKKIQRRLSSEQDPEDTPRTPCTPDMGKV